MMLLRFLFTLVFILSGYHCEAVRVLSYNVLSPEYAYPHFYPHWTECQLSWEFRFPRIVDRILEGSADVVCLQEVSPSTWDDLEEALAPHGYKGLFVAHSNGRDGVATLVRTAAIALKSAQADLCPQSSKCGTYASRAALSLLCLDGEGNEFCVINTKLAWMPPDTTMDKHPGYRQICHLLDTGPSLSSQVLVGDFNVEPEHPILQTLFDRGFVDSHVQSAPTCYANGCLHRVDYVLTRGAAAATPYRSEAELVQFFHSEPSDHIPVFLDIEWGDS